MANLLSTYENLVAQRNSKFEKTASNPATGETNVLYKYASAADELLAKEFGNDYTADDVVELAEKMISYDVDQIETMEKVAELEQAGIIMAKAFKAELNS